MTVDHDEHGEHNPVSPVNSPLPEQPVHTNAPCIRT